MLPSVTVMVFVPLPMPSIFPPGSVQAVGADPAESPFLIREPSSLNSLSDPPDIPALPPQLPLPPP